MKSTQIVITGKKQVELLPLDLDASPLQPHEALIETECSFISAGTELSIYTAADSGVFREGSWCAYPWTAGYANVGVVREAGERFRHLIGKRVFSNGGHASFLRYASDSRYKMLAPVPAGLTSEDAVAARMAMVAIAGLEAAAPRHVRWVVVIGLGMVGNLAAQLFHLTGARVIGIDPSPRRRALAQECGIARVAGGSEEEVAEEIRRITGGRMADVAVDAVGHSSVSLQALRLVSDGGEVIVLGTPRADVQGNLTEVFAAAHLRWITVKGTLEWNLPVEPALPQYNSLSRRLEGIFGWIGDGRLRLRPLLTHVLPPERIGDAYEGLLHHKEEYVGVILRWRETAPDAQ